MAKCQVLLTALVLLADANRHVALTSADRCASLPHAFQFKQNMVMSEYNATSETLFLDITDLVYKFCEASIYFDNSSFTVRLDLVASTMTSLKRKCNGHALDPAVFRVQDSAVLHPRNPVTTFKHVQGKYLVRFSECEAFGKECSVQACSKVYTFEPTVPMNGDVCNATAIGGTNSSGSGLSDVSDVSASVDILDKSNMLDFHSCTVHVSALVPLCTARQSYSRARIFTVEVGMDEACLLRHHISFIDAKSGEVFIGDGHNSTVSVLPCSDRLHSSCGNATSGLDSQPYGIISHRLYDLSRNSSYCVFYQLLDPHCAAAAPASASAPDLPTCFFFGKRVSCDVVQAPHGASLLNEPMFIGCVSLTLFLSLALLMWTVVQCSKKKAAQSPTLQPIKKPVRSLTEDDLEHIARLPSQEIVLVYFPDTKRFRELNRKFRNWLITLDVNDVKDIYDEKCSEEVLRDPEKWVREALRGPEKRIILVCSRLAYECLLSVKKGITSPKFVESDPHFGLLTRTIQYLDKEMKGNYRNLICVRYEDLKICDRQYSSEAFDIVPGTEYVLPQHLEDVYRWIHPRQPRPECWSEARSEVKELLDAMRVYRHHDDNMFTVQFTKDEATSPTLDEDK